MTQPLLGLSVNLLIEHGGHQVKLEGEGKRFAAKFPTFLSVFHFSRFWWALRKQIPREVSFHMECQGLRIPVKSGT
jgi:hypothetical protein